MRRYLELFVDNVAELTGKRTQRLTYRSNVLVRSQCHFLQLHQQLQTHPSHGADAQVQLTSTSLF